MSKMSTYKLFRQELFIRASDNVTRLSVAPVDGHIEVYQENEYGSIKHYNVDCGFSLASNNDLPLDKVTINAKNGECNIMFLSDEGDALYNKRNRRILLLLKN